MSLIKSRKQPLSLWDQFQDQFFNNALETFFDEGRGLPEMTGWIPRMDVKENHEAYTVRLDLPGVKKDDIKIQVLENNVLLIDGHRKSREEKEIDNYVKIERFDGKFTRSIQLTDAIDKDGIRATSRDGILEILIPKSSKSQTRHITVE